MKYVVMRDARTGLVFETVNPNFHKDCENLGNGPKAKHALQEYARSELRKILKAGQAVYTVLRSESSSGMSRTLSLCVPGDGFVRCIDSMAAAACGMRESGNGRGLVIGGSGMDMGFHAVYSLGRAVFPEGFGTLGKHPNGRTYRPSTPARARAAVKRGYVFRGRNCDATGWDNDGGYAFSHSWL